MRLETYYICVIDMSFKSNIFTTFNSNLHTHDMYLGGWVHPGEYASAGWYLIICNKGHRTHKFQ